MSHLCVEFHSQLATSSSFSTLVLTYQIECFNLVTYLRSRMGCPKLVEIKLLNPRTHRQLKSGGHLRYSRFADSEPASGATLNVLH